MTDSNEPEPDALAARLVAACRDAGRSVATAESLTGGLLGATITSVPGASAIYRGGVITYATDAKSLIGGVDPRILNRDGAVSAATATAMASHAAHVLQADLAAALTGVAGPDAQEGHPAGTVWLGWYAGGSADATRLHVSGGRGAIRWAAVEAALQRLLDLVGSAGEYLAGSAGE